MRQNMADIDSAENIVDLGDQPVLIALDVKHCPLVRDIRRRKSLIYRVGGGLPRNSNDG
jgi:hypothetical protein